MSRNKRQATKKTAPPKPPAFYWHITETENVEPILRDGLRGSTTPRNRGEVLATPSVFVLTTNQENLHRHVAMSQIWYGRDVESYGLLKIDAAGITGVVRGDAVAEQTAPWHRVIEQDMIPPQYVSLETMYPFHYPGVVVRELMDVAMWRRKWTAGEWAVARVWLDEAAQLYQRKYEAGELSGPGGKIA